MFNPADTVFNWAVEDAALSEVLVRIEQGAWGDAVHEFVDSLPDQEAQLIWSRTFWPLRSALQTMLPVAASDRVLEIGPGFGAIALHVAPNCQEYVVLDQMRIYLDWLQHAATDRRIDNIRYVCSRTERFLPFQDGQFDQVIMNGVFEWVASNTLRDPRQVQQDYLREVERVLAPDGSLYIGIENRINYKYFRGSREGHIRMKYGALLPRFVTRAYLKLARNQQFREYTYTALGYRKLLRRAGLGGYRFYSTLPHYSEVRLVYPLELRRRQLAAAKSRGWRKLDSSARFSKPRSGLFSHCLGMSATVNGRETANLVECVLGRIRETADIFHGPVLLDALCKVTSGGKVVVKLRDGDRTCWLAIALNQAAVRGLENEQAARRFFAGKERVAGRAEELLPRTLAAGQWEKYGYLAQEYRPGLSGSGVCRSSEARDDLLEEVYGFLRLLYDSGEDRVLEGDLFRRLVGEPCEGLRLWFSRGTYVRYQDWHRWLTGWLRERLYGQTIRLVPGHGDLVPNNCLVRDGKLAGIVDWDEFRPAGLPLEDLVMFVGNAYRHEQRQRLSRSGKDPDTIAFHGYPELFVKGPLRGWMDRYLEDCRIPGELFLPLLATWWLGHLQDNLAVYRFSRKWKTKRVAHVIERWRRSTAERVGER